MLHVRLFGTVRISHDQWQSETKVRPIAQALLAFLLLNGPRPHPRERLAELLWSEHRPDQARSCLSTTLWRLRQAVEPGSIPQGAYLITPSADEIGFNWDSDHWLDVADFEQKIDGVLAKPAAAVHPTDLETLSQAMQLYQGDVLENIYLDWAVAEQERLRGVYLNCLEYLMKYHQQRGDYPEALVYGQRLLEREPLREETHREMMRLYLKNGQRALAVRQYEVCQQILAKELSLNPMPETEQLYYLAKNPGMSGLSEDIQPALRQLNATVEDLEKSQRQLNTALKEFEESRRRVRQALRQFERSVRA